jgi:hypothetical protein
MMPIIAYPLPQPATPGLPKFSITVKLVIHAGNAVTEPNPKNKRQRALRNRMLPMPGPFLIAGAAVRFDLLSELKVMDIATVVLLTRSLCDFAGSLKKPFKGNGL